MRGLAITTELLTGIADVDTQHRSMAAWIRALQELGPSPADRSLADRAARFVVAYVAYHFAAEEYVMAVTAYPHLAAHRQQHGELRARVDALRRPGAGGGAGDVPAPQLLRLLEDWAERHIRTADRDFARHCAADPSIGALRLPSPAELVAFGRTLDDYDSVEFVHGAGEVTTAEVRARLAGRADRD